MSNKIYEQWFSSLEICTDEITYTNMLFTQNKIL